MLSSTIAKLATSVTLDSSETDQLARVIFRYALNLNKAKDLKIIGASFNITRSLLDYKKNYLDNTHYVLSRLWRAVYTVYLKQRKCMFCKEYLICTDKQFPCYKYSWDLKKVAQHYNVTQQDIQYILDNNIIEHTDMPILLKRIHSLELPDTSDAQINNILYGLINYIRNRVNKKLTFIYNYHNLDAEDFISEILACVTQSLIANDYIVDQEKLTIIAKRIVKQEICNIISKYTAQKRNRLINTADGYESVTLSLDSDYGEESSCNLHNAVRDNKINESQTTVTSLLRKIRRQVTEEERLFIDIKTGKVIPKDLLKHTVQRSGKQLNNLKENTANKAIYDYLGWNYQRVKRFQNKVKTLLANL